MSTDAIGTPQCVGAHAGSHSHSTAQAAGSAPATGPSETWPGPPEQGQETSWRKSRRRSGYMPVSRGQSAARVSTGTVVPQRRQCKRCRAAPWVSRSISTHAALQDLGHAGPHWGCRSSCRNYRPLAPLRAHGCSAPAPMHLDCQHSPFQAVSRGKISEVKLPRNLYHYMYLLSKKLKKNCYSGV